MSGMLDFLEVLLPQLPPKLIPVGGTRSENRERPFIVYSDASFGEGRAGLGIVVVAPSGETYYSSAICPEWLQQMIEPKAGQAKKRKRAIICQLELLATITANDTFSDILRGQRVIYFIDNTAALSCVVHGYSSKPEMATLTNMYHLQNFKLGIDAWHEWVPSSANIADLPSRRRFDKNSSTDNWSPLLQMGAIRREMRIPRRESFLSLRHWYASL